MLGNHDVPRGGLGRRGDVTADESVPGGEMVGVPGKCGTDIGDVVKATDELGHEVGDGKRRRGRGRGGVEIVGRQVQRLGLRAGNGGEVDHGEEVRGDAPLGDGEDDILPVFGHGGAAHALGVGGVTPQNGV